MRGRQRLCADATIRWSSGNPPHVRTDCQAGKKGGEGGEGGAHVESRAQTLAPTKVATMGMEWR